MRDYLAPLVGETEDGTEALLPEEQTILARRRRFSGEGWLEPAEGGPLPEGGAEAPRPEAGQGDPPAAGPGAGQENVLAGLLAGAVQEDRLPPLPRGQGVGELSHRLARTAQAVRWLAGGGTAGTVPLPSSVPGERGTDWAALARAVERDARRYDRGFPLY